MPPQQPQDQDLDVIQHPLYGTLKFPKTMGMDQRNQIIDNLAPAGSPKGGPPVPAAHPPANFDRPATAYNPGEGKPGGYPEALRPVGNIGRTALSDFTSIPGQMKAVANAPPQGMSGGDILGNLVGGPAYGPVKSLVQSTKRSYDEGGLEKAATDTAGHLLSGTLAGEAAGGLIKGANAIPRTGRAAANLADIENAAKDVPVSLTKTQPAMANFKQSVATGGRNAPVMTKLGSRIAPPNEPLNFPEARQFYSNIGTATAKPGFLRSAIESPNMPKFRYNAGNVQGALNSDLTDAANSIGRGEDYTGAMNEYRRGSQLKAVGKNVGKAAIGAGAGAAIGAPLYNKLRNLIPLILLFLTPLCFGQAARSLPTSSVPCSLHSLLFLLLGQRIPYGLYLCGMAILVLLSPLWMWRTLHIGNSFWSLLSASKFSRNLLYLFRSSIIVPIECALRRGNPTAVARFIVTFIVDAIQEKPWIRLWPNVSEKRCKRLLPLIAHSDSSTAVSVVTDKRGEIAPILHVSPSGVFLRRLPSGVSMRFHGVIIACFAIFLFGVSSISYGQAARYSGTVYTINSSAPLPGALYPVLASTSATINICTAPATGFTVLNAATQSISKGCTNYAVTYTNAAESGTCTAPKQLTRTNSTTCVGTVDAEGNFGQWMAAGTYQYTVTLSYGSFGPYDFTVGGTGGGSCGPLAGDPTSTNCGNGNQPLSTGNEVQTFGYQNLTMINAQSHIQVFGDGNLQSQPGFGVLHGNLLVAGDGNIINMNPTGKLVALGSGNFTANLANVGASVGNFQVVAGYNNAQVTGGIGANNVIAGANNVVFTDPTTTLGFSNIILGDDNVTGIGRGGFGVQENIILAEFGMVGVSGQENIIFGEQPASNFSGTPNYNFNENLAMGKFAMSDIQTSGSIQDNNVVGQGSLSTQRGTCDVSQNVVMGHNDVVSGCTNNSTVLGSNNDTGGATVTNAIVISNNNATQTNVASNTTVIGNSSTTSLKIFGAGTGCLSASAGVITGSGSACGSGGGGGSNVTVNGGATLPTANLNGTTPAAGTNGINATIQVSGANVSAEIIGDGNSGHFLSGIGTFIVPLTLTTTGTSGAATFSGGTLNIPNYAGAISSVSNSDGTLTISPTTGAVVASLALGHANTWSALQTHSAGINFSGASSPLQFGGNAGTVGQCPISGGTGVTPSWGTCGGAGGSPGGSNTNLQYNNAGSFGGDTNTADDGAGNLSMVSVTLTGTPHGMTIPAGTAVSGVAGKVIYASDASNGYGEINENNTGLSRICTSGNGVCSGGTGTLVASAEVVSFSATPTFSTSTNVSRISLTNNITSFTLGTASDGQDKKLCFKQGGGSYTVAPPANVHGFFTIGTINGDWNCQSFVYDNTDSIWLATNTGAINQ